MTVSVKVALGLALAAADAQAAFLKTVREIADATAGRKLGGIAGDRKSFSP